MSNSNRLKAIDIHNKLVYYLGERIGKTKLHKLKNLFRENTLAPVAVDSIENIYELIGHLMTQTIIAYGDYSRFVEQLKITNPDLVEYVIDKEIEIKALKPVARPERSKDARSRDLKISSDLKSPEFNVNCAMPEEGIPVKSVDLKEIIHKMAEAQLPPKTDEEKQCLEQISESNCADILRQVIYCKVGRPQCLVFCREVSEKYTTFTPTQQGLLYSGNISDFDVALCIKVARQINGINPNKERWNSKVAENNHTLFGSLKRIALFLKEVIYCPAEGELDFHELFRLISTAFQDIQREMRFERDFHADLDVIRNKVLTPVYNPLLSQVETDEPPHEHPSSTDSDVEVEYWFLDRYSSKERSIANEKISLIKNYKHRFPLELAAPQADVMVVYSENDRMAAAQFRRSIDGRDFTRLDNGKQAKVKACAVLYDDERFWKSKLKTVELAYENSTYAFLYLTKSFCENDFNTLVAESILIDSINNKEKKWQVVVIHTSPLKNGQYKMPFGINALKSLDVWNPDIFFWQTMDALLGLKICKREDREIKTFERKYEEAVRIQIEDKKREDSIDEIEKLSLNRTQPQQDRPITDEED